MLNWNAIKSEDRKALHYYARGCCNTMEDVEFLDEMNSTSNMRNVIMKLPFKLREKWRTTAYAYYEHNKTRAKFPILVDFIEKHARIASDPMFGDIQDVMPKRDIKVYKSPSNKPAHGYKGSSCVTVTSPIISEEQKPFQNIKSEHKGITVKRRCVFCAGEHTSETCNMNKKSHNEKIDCLKAQGICFGCLTKGHLSKDCQKRMKCEVCSMKHPTILHIYKKRIEQLINTAKQLL